VGPSAFGYDTCGQIHCFDFLVYEKMMNRKFVYQHFMLPVPVILQIHGRQILAHELLELKMVCDAQIPSCCSSSLVPATPWFTSGLSSTNHSATSGGSGSLSPDSCLQVQNFRSQTASVSIKLKP